MRRGEVYDVNLEPVQGSEQETRLHKSLTNTVTADFMQMNTDRRR